MLDLGPSGSSGVDLLIHCAEQWIEDPCRWDELQLPKHVETLQNFRRQLEGNYRRSLRLVPQGPYQSHLAALDKAFELFRAGGRRLESFIKHRRREDLEVGCTRVHSAVVTLQELARPLREMEQSWKAQAQEGWLGELLFLQERLRTGEWTSQAVSTTLGFQLEATRATREQLARAASEWKEPSLEVAMHLLKITEKALLRLQECLGGKAVTEWEQRFEELIEAVRPLQDVLHTLEKQAPEVSLQEPPRPRLLAFADLERACQSYLNGSASSEASLALLRKFAQDLRQGRARIEQANDLHEEQVTRMLCAVEQALEALSGLESALEAAGPDLVQISLERVLEAESEMILARPDP